MKENKKTSKTTSRRFSYMGRWDGSQGGLYTLPSGVRLPAAPPLLLYHKLQGGYNE